MVRSPRHRDRQPATRTNRLFSSLDLHRHWPDSTCGTDQNDKKIRLDCSQPSLRLPARSNRHFQFPLFALPLAEIQRRVVQIKTIEKYNLIALCLPFVRLHNQILVSIALICIGARRDPAMCGTNQDNRKIRFDRSRWLMSCIILIINKRAATSFHSGIKPSFSGPLICGTGRRIPASSSTNKGK